MKKIIVPFFEALYTPSLNEFVRKAVLRFEIPLLRKIFELHGARVSHVRGSVTNPEFYHFLLSDIDFTLVADASIHHALQLRRQRLRNIFLNLGELELHTPPEWEELNALMSSPHYHYWTQLNLVRKTRWQEAKLNQAIGSAEKKKQLRGLELTLRKLSSTSKSLAGSRIFTLPEGARSSHVILPYYSHYLERSVTAREELGSLWFDDEEAAKALVAILPDNDIVPDQRSLRDIKTLLIRREKLQTLVSLRVRSFEQKDFDPLTHQTWLQDLDRRLDLVMST